MVLVYFRGTIETANLSHELERSISNLRICGGRIEIEECPDVSTQSGWAPLEESCRCYLVLPVVWDRAGAIGE